MTSEAKLTLSLPPTRAGSSSARGREIVFVDGAPASMAAAARGFAERGYARFVLLGEDGAVRGVAERLRTLIPATVEAAGASTPEGGEGTVHLYAGIDGEELGSALTSHVDAPNAALLAPVGSRHSSRVPLFLISIPKAGTHLLYELARSLGYQEGVVCPDEPRGGTWYCVEYSNSHTTARDFLVDTTRRRPFGNKHHPFFRLPALFIYRYPLDILVSEAHWFHQPANSPLAGYLSGLDFHSRLLRLADDPWLLGTIRDRVGGFIPWLDFPNVIPLSFEELVGARGGASDEAQLDLIWSIQLKLQVGGRPEDIARRVFNPESPTFSAGRIGGWTRHRTPELVERLRRLPSDYLEAYGFGSDVAGEITPMPARAAEFRHRRLVLPKIDFHDTAIAVESAFFEHNIVRYRDRFFTVPHAIGAVDLARDADRSLSGIKSSATLDAAIVQILRRRVLLGNLWSMWKSIYARLRRG